MGVVNTKSAQITAADATQPVAFANTLTTGAVLRESVDTLEVAAADSDTSVYRFMRIRSSHRLSQITLFNDAIAGGTNYDCGLYKTAHDGGAAVSVHLFAATVDLTVATTLGIELLFYTLGIETIAYPVWQMLGLSSDPGIYYDICLTGNTVGTGAGTLSMRTRYVMGT